jgi:outer membrane protein OmpA-like peptidoglycan-associated protein
MRTVRVATLLAAAILAGCAAVPQDRVVLLPGPDGKVGQIAVNPGSSETVLGGAYASATVDAKGKLAQAQLNSSQIAQQFGDALGALPPRPKSFTLYFELDSDQLTPASAEQAQAALAEIAARPIADVIVIGHTDRTGELTYNDALSLQRAEVVRDKLIAAGGDPARITATGRGEREPLVPTDDEVPEPKNRRAELSVR